MTMLKQDRPRQVAGDHFIVEQLMKEVMIYDQKRNKAFCLNHKAALVWQHCDGQTTIEQLETLLRDASSEPVDEAVVRFTLESLAADGLLEPATFVSQIPAGMTRRSLVQKFGLTAAMSLPLVTTLLIAPPKAHASSTTSKIPTPAPKPSRP